MTMRARARLVDVVAVEGTKLSRQASTFVMLGIIVGYLVLLVLALASVLRVPEAAGASGAASLLAPLRADAVGFVAEIVSSISVIVVIVLAAQLAGQEFSRGTLRLLLVSRARRVDVALGKLVLLAIAALVLSLVVALGAVGGAAVFSAVTGEALLHVDAGSLAMLAFRSWTGIFAWAVITFGVTLLARSLGVGIGSTLGALIAGDVLRGLMLGLGTAGLWATRALPNTAINAVSGRAAIDASAWAWIVPNLLVYVVGLNAIAVWKLQTMDVIAATK